MADGDLVYLPARDGTPYPLGRSVLWHDPANRAYRALDTAPRRAPRPGPWYTRDIFDQLGSSCTAAAAVGVLRTSPNLVPGRAHWARYDSEAERFALYRRAQRLDPWAGEEPDYEGSSTDAPFKVLRAEGAISGWRWLFGLAELRTFLLTRGPVAVGTLWYESLFRPDRTGTVRIVDADGVAGGHAWRIVGYDQARRRYRMCQSWGRGFGQGGRAWIGEPDLERLLAEQGEACAPA